ncbi:hypothetical protein PYW07_014058 [Mythimna separata]|uniref:Large ribosomal subunit protein mL52 n=1 Tax=Mythimna separata TaxID=271217 RepID=A0AAD8DPG4_MYTSE|nr:hypothetical protein PYW07_014058 [Mythimna separata]
MSIVLKNLAIASQTHLIYRALSTSTAVCSKQWRVQHGLSLNRNAEGVLTDTPDFTYLDGRPTPLLQKQKKRILRQREFASKIVELCSEIDFAKERHNYLQAAKEDERKSIIANRLKPKGTALKAKK